MKAFGLGLFLLISFSILLFFVVLPLIALIDLVRSEFKDSSNKLIWVLIVLFFPIIGSVLYFVLGRDQKVR